MLQSMRDNLKGTVAIFIVLFLGLIMALSLIDLNSLSGNSRFDEVATVEGRAITERELQLALQQERQRLQQQFGDSLPADFLSDDRLRVPVIQNLVQRAVLLDTGTDGKMTVSNADVDELIVSLPDFQVDGKFDPNTFVQRVRLIGHTPASFRNLVREDVVVNQLRNGLTATAFMTDAEIEQVVALSRQTRDFSWVLLPLGDLPEQVTVTDEEIQQHYDDNKQNYNTEEKVSVEYIELKVSDIAATIDIADEELRQQYQQEVDNFTAATEREAAHIMIEGDDDAARQKIAEVQTKLAAGEDFAALAKTYSDDFGSKDNGGNLGVSSGDAFPEAFETTLTTLQTGEVSGPVAIDGNTHFIKLLSANSNQPPAFDEIRDRLLTTLQTQQAEERFIEKLTALKDLAYNADTLKEVGEQLDLVVGTTDLFTREGGREPVLADFRVVNAAFSDQVVKQGFTSEVLELAPDHAVVVNLLEHQPVRTLTLEEKRNEILAQLKLEKAEEQLAATAQELEDKAKTGESLQALSEANGLTLETLDKTSRDQSGINGELLDAVFALPRPADQPVITSVKLPGEGYGIVALNSVVDGDYAGMTDEERRSARLSLARSAAIDEFQAWQTQQVEQADVEIAGISSADQ